MNLLYWVRSADNSLIAIDQSMAIPSSERMPCFLDG
jgi:hypothetical protein